jgi:hypothetical protein
MTQRQTGPVLYLTLIRCPPSSRFTLRIVVENWFGIVKQLWPFVCGGSAAGLQLQKSPVASWYLAANILTCFHSCLRGNCINVQYNTRHFNLESWLEGAPRPEY